MLSDIVAWSKELQCTLTKLPRVLVEPREQV